MVIAPSGKFTVLHLTWFVPVQWIVEIREQMLPFCSEDEGVIKLEISRQVYSRKSAVGTFNMCFVK
ncbi:hypothetical protein SADUNF_Sadunf02G0143100 [Salix dunnii]|uniref:Uncharacterized protein n=1 Tax=Salix dunnii TaxID=1413687 RepID=A0A835TK73_9ROSI|nr:hypothetical protein SADUNF_Sadunf02G0143100 [Salix dunnii]